MIGILEQYKNIGNQVAPSRFFEVIDYSSYGLFYMYAPFRSAQSVAVGTSGAARPLVIKRSTNSGDWYAVDFDANNTISIESTCRALDAAPNLRLGDILGFDNWDIVRFFSQLEPSYYHGTSLTNVGKLRFATAGVIETKGGVFSAKWLGVGGFNTASGIKSEINSGNDVSFISVFSSIGDESFGMSFVTARNSTTGLRHIVDRRTNALNTYMFTPAGFFASNLAQRNDDGFFVQAFTINGSTKVMKSYINGVFQNQVTFSGNYTNNGFVIGGANDLSSNTLTGHQGALLGGAQEWTATQVADLTAILKTQFNIS